MEPGEIRKVFADETTDLCFDVDIGTLGISFSADLEIYIPNQEFFS